MIILSIQDLAIAFNQFPLFQDVLKILGSRFFSYIWLTKLRLVANLKEKEIKNPAKFFNMIVFQFINPKAVLIAIITVSTFISQNENFIRDSIIVVGFAIFFSFTSIMSWSLLGKFLRRFANNEKFLKIYNYVMSFLLIICVIMFYV